MPATDDEPPRALPLDGTFDSIDYWAARLGVDERVVRQMIDNGELPAMRAGRQWRIPRKLACEWLYKACVRSVNIAFATLLLDTLVG